MPVAEIERKVLETLDNLGIPYVRHEHPPVATVEEAEKHWAGLKGTHCKNLFLRNYKGNRHYLVIAPVTRGIDLKRLTAELDEDRLSFASAERLKRWLGVEPGSVSPFGLVNDETHHVQVVCDYRSQVELRPGLSPQHQHGHARDRLGRFRKIPGLARQHRPLAGALTRWRSPCAADLS